MSTVTPGTPGLTEGRWCGVSPRAACPQGQPPAVWPDSRTFHCGDPLASQSCQWDRQQSCSCANCVAEQGAQLGGDRAHDLAGRDRRFLKPIRVNQTPEEPNCTVRLQNVRKLSGVIRANSCRRLPDVLAKSRTDILPLAILFSGGPS